LIDNNSASVNYGRPITSIVNPYGPLGSPLANSPPFEANLRARYEWSISEYQAFIQAGGQHQAHSLSRAGNSSSVTSTLRTYDIPGYSTYDGSLGIARDAWTVEFFGQNLFDSHASTFTTFSQWAESQAIVRPRVLGVRFNYKFSDRK
jgi:iron complex outermembrane receptor protein